MRASAANNDRFEEHAIVYALIKLNNINPLLVALNNSSDNVKNSINCFRSNRGGALRKENLAAFLASKKPSLQKSGIWVASHHPEWSDIVINLLKSRFSTNEIYEDDIISMRELMITFCHDNKLQVFISEQLESKTSSIAKKIFLMDVITQAHVVSIPIVWVQSLVKLLENGDEEIKSRVLGLIESRRIKSLNGQLNQIIQQEFARPDFRLKALSSKLLSEPNLSDKEFNMLFSYLGKQMNCPFGKCLLG